MSSQGEDSTLLGTDTPVGSFDRDGGFGSINLLERSPKDRVRVRELDQTGSGFPSGVGCEGNNVRNSV